MTRKSFAWYASTAWRVVAVALGVLFSLATARAGEKVIFQFNQNQGYNPTTGLISDSAGNLYGTTIWGGSGGWGTVFELSPGSNGKWTETVLYSFLNNKTGETPYGTLTMDKAGNLYGTVQNGDFNDTGFVYELLKGTNGTWTEKIVHNFGLNEGGPLGDLTWDSAGNLYGATYAPDTTFSGEVFKLTPQPNGSWKETVLFTFPAANGVGAPQGGPVFDGKGNLYGGTFYGIGGFDSNSTGAVYELSPQASGPWTLTVLYNFTTTSKSQFPDSRLTFDSKGNLFGKAQGQGFYGTLFEVSPGFGGTWTATTLHTFNAGSDAGHSLGPLIFDAGGNLYGTSYDGGTGCSQSLCGTVYKLIPQTGGAWKESVIYPFESASDGSQANSGLFLDSSGNLYGTTYHGGSRYGYGTVYKITP